MVRVRVRFRLGLGASLLLIADCRCTIAGDRGPVTGSRYNPQFIVDPLLDRQPGQHLEC